MKRLFRAWVGIAGVLLSTVAWADFTVEKSFPMSAGGLLKLDTDVGSIEVHSHNRDEIQVTVEVEGMDEEEFEVSFNASSDSLKIEGNGKNRSWNWGSRRVHFDILVPKSFNLDMRTSGGSIVVADLEGDVEVDTSGGSLSFGNIKGRIDGHTSGGSITVEGAEGDVRVKTSGGSLTFGEIKGDVYGRTSGGSISVDSVEGETNVATSGGSVRIDDAGGSVKAKTSGGSVSVTFSQQPKGDSELTTSAGSITAYLPEDINVDLYARGMKVRSDFEVNGQYSAKYKLKGPINKGGYELELQTSAGSVYVRKK